MTDQPPELGSNGRDLRDGDGGAPPESLLDLAAETRALVQRLESNLRANPERLSIASFNQAVARTLRNQVAILEVLSRLIGAGREGGTRAPVPADAVADGSDDVDVTPDQPIRIPAPAPAPGAPAPQVAGFPARTFVEAFDNRDRSFDRGLEKLNLWVGGGGGTPFQYRGTRAYLNVSGLGPDNVLRFEELLMERMGFSIRLGRLVIDGLRGEIVVYEKARISGSSGLNEE